jgi:4-hydroxythreonine-4-phosphate dehydrogenase
VDRAGTDNRRAKNGLTIRHEATKKSSHEITKNIWRRLSSPMKKPRVAITVGDPAGIGPEVAGRAAADPSVLELCEPVLYATDADATFTPGVVSGQAGRAAYDLIVRAAADAQRGAVDAIATAPINKEAFRLAHLPWTGHTDLLAHLTGAERVAMMFHSDVLRVVLATVHVALADVARTLTRTAVESTIALTAAAMPRFGFAAPRIAVAGLNPHAGEHGLFGCEEEQVIAPAIAACRARGVDVSGPFPADTVFVRATRGEFDVVIACYHDQGLIPVKLVAFGQAVNVTLGLPIIRTSVDHGTAFDIAGRGIADPASMIAAVRLAAKLASTIHAERAESAARK